MVQEDSQKKLGELYQSIDLPKDLIEYMLNLYQTHHNK